jgi:hypothetical protein
MGLSSDDIVAKFPNKILPIIDDEPDYGTINNMVQLLYGNAASLPTSLGGGQHGHIGLIMTPLLYTTLSPTPYTAPNDPGTSPPVLPNNASVGRRETTRLDHKEALRIFQNNNTMDDVLKTQIIDSIHDPYICEMRNKYTGYLGVTTRDLIDHLLDRYGKITPADIEQCKTKMNAPLDSTQPIDIFFKRIDDCVQYAADGNVAFTADQILQTAYHAISKSGIYNDACKEWRKKPPIDKTWTAFKSFFATEYHDLKEQQRINVSSSNFHGANAALDISHALDNLALAATTDKDIVAQLTATNKDLSAHIKNLTTQLQIALDTNAILAQKLGDKIKPNDDKRGGRQRLSRAEWEANLDPEGYCWTHGYRVQHGHNSQNCGGKLEGHQTTATRTNIQGGSVRGKT